MIIQSHQVLPLYMYPGSLAFIHACTYCFLQALSGLVDAVKSKLSASLDLQRLGLESEAETLRKQLDSVVSFGLRVAQEDPAMLEVAARDFAFSLAHIYIG